MFNDQNLTCKECGVSFLFTAAEQQFFHERALANKPKRCHNCRLSLRKQRHPEKIVKISSVPCARCTVITTVPFEPNGCRPVLCLACLHEDKLAQRQQRIEQIQPEHTDSLPALA